MLYQLSYDLHLQTWAKSICTAPPQAATGRVDCGRGGGRRRQRDYTAAMRFACVQYDMAWEDKPSNHATIERMLAEAKSILRERLSDVAEE